MNPGDLKPFTISVETINKYVKSTHVLAGCSIQGLFLPAFTNSKDPTEVESKLRGLDGDAELMWKSSAAMAVSYRGLPVLCS